LGEGNGGGTCSWGGGEESAWNGGEQNGSESHRVLNGRGRRQGLSVLNGRGCLTWAAGIVGEFYWDSVSVCASGVKMFSRRPRAWIGELESESLDRRAWICGVAVYRRGILSGLRFCGYVLSFLGRHCVVGVFFGVVAEVLYRLCIFLDRCRSL
jgi:hypothetical protein